MLDGEANTGVTLQTLHPQKFDAGIVLDQTPEPGIAIPNPETYTFGDLQNMSADMAAAMLIKAVRQRSFVPPYRDVHQATEIGGVRLVSYAPKIDRNMRCVDFRSMTGPRILRMNRAISPLWAEAHSSDGFSTTPIILDTALLLVDQKLENGKDLGVIPSIEVGRPYVSLSMHDRIDTTSAPLLINTIDGSTLVVPRLKVPGSPFRAAVAASQTAKLLAEPRDHNGGRVVTFHLPMSAPGDTKQEGLDLLTNPKRTT